MWVVCGGMKRSGSTLQYQLAARLVERLGAGRRYPKQDLASEEIPENEPAGGGWTVFKTHICSERVASILREGRAKGLYVYRDLRDVVVSLMAMKGHAFEKTMSRRDLPKAVDQFGRWTSCPGLLVSRYEEMIVDPAREVARIGGHLGLEVPPSLAMEIAADYTVERQKARIADAKAGGQMSEVDGRLILAEERLHANHIFTGGAGGWRQVLSPEQVAKVEQVYGDWLRAQGYIT